MTEQHPSEWGDIPHEIRKRLALSSVIGRWVKLQRKGHEHQGLCPFHKEKTPSFTINDAKGFYHCFGCGAHGDAFDFIMKKNNLGFREALHQLAYEAGVSLPEYRNPSAKQEHEKRQLDYQALQYVQQVYGQMIRLPDHRWVVDYAMRRGLSESSMIRFGVGYAPAANTPQAQDFFKNLRDYNITNSTLVEIGVIKEINDPKDRLLKDRLLKDRLQGRLIFPIHSSKGQVIGFGGRALRDGHQPKYLNSPDTPYFHKGQVLFGLYQSLKFIQEQRQVILVEGYMDVMMLHQHGFENAVAPLGTAVTEDQLRTMWQWAEEIVVCLDGDDAGLGAAMRLLDRALPLLVSDKKMTFMLLPRGEDPDTLLNKYGRKTFEDQLSKTIDISDLLWRLATWQKDIRRPEDAAAVEFWLQKTIAVIQDQSLKWHYREAFRQKLRQTQKMTSQNRRGQIRVDHNVLGSYVNPRHLQHRWEQALMVGLVAFPHLIEENLETLVEIRLQDANYDLLRNAMIQFYMDEVLASGSIQSYLKEHCMGLVDYLKIDPNLYQVAPFLKPDTPQHDLKAGIGEILAYIKKQHGRNHGHA